MKKTLLVLVIVFAAYQSGIFSSKQTFNVDENVDVVFLSAEWCGYCDKTRKLLNKHNIPHVEYDMEKSDKGKQYYEELGKGGIPILIINGEVVRGYSPKETLRKVGS